MKINNQRFPAYQILLFIAAGTNTVDSYHLKQTLGCPKGGKARTAGENAFASTHANCCFLSRRDSHTSGVVAPILDPYDVTLTPKKDTLVAEKKLRITKS